MLSVEHTRGWSIMIQLKIKPLVWEEMKGGFYAKTPWGEYLVNYGNHSQDGKADWVTAGDTETASNWKEAETIDAAKIECEKHYEAAVLSCLGIPS